MQRKSGDKSPHFKWLIILALLLCIPFFGYSLDSPAQLKEKIPLPTDTPIRIGYLAIEKDHPIDTSTFLHIKLALDSFQKEKVAFVVLRLNTPGGEVFSALKISQLLQEIDTKDHIPVVAWIDNWAVSAGAMLAYSCRVIAVTPSSIMGAAEPVMMKGEGQVETASEKVNSALRAEFSNLARFYGRDPLIAQAMVDKDLLVVLRDGKGVALQDEKEVLSTDILIAARGKLLTLNSEELVRFGLANVESPASKSTDKGPDALLQAPFFNEILSPIVIDYKNWRVDFFAFLSHPMVASLLYMGLILGIYIEVTHGGSGLFGALAVGCLGLILLSSFSLYAIRYLELIFIACGAILIIADIFLGLGVLSVIGIIMIALSAAALTLPSLSAFEWSLDKDKLSFAGKEFLERAAYLSLAIMISLIIMVVLGKFFRSRKGCFYGPLVSAQESTTPLEVEVTLGSEGMTVSSLRPSGKVMIDGKLYEASSEGYFIEKDTPIIVIGKAAHRIIVRIKI